MKSLMIAGMLVIGATGAVSAAGLPIDPNLTPDRDAPVVTQVAWIGRYGQVCYHGPVWLRSCHASNNPGQYIPGHWNPMRTRWIPGRYS